MMMFVVFGGVLVFRGMIVLQFCFEESVPEVKKYPPERWLYTGTHDNQTLRGWFESLSPIRHPINIYRNIVFYISLPIVRRI